MRALRAFGAWLDRRETGESLAVLRVAFGLCVVLTVGSVWVHGLVPLMWLTDDHGGYRQHLRTPWLFELLDVRGPTAVWSTVAVSITAGLAMMVGLGGRFTALVALWSYLALKHINGHAGGSYEVLLTNALWLLVLAPSTATWSLDCRLKTGSWSSDRPVPVWCRHLFVFQLAIVYGTTGLQKMGSQWTPIGGMTAVYYVLQDLTWRRVDVPGAGWLAPFAAIGTGVTWLFESTWALLPLYLWKRRPGATGRLARFAQRVDLRYAYAAFGLALHVGIWVLMQVSTFSWITLSFYAALWRPEEVTRALGWLGRRAGSARTAG